MALTIIEPATDTKLTTSWMMRSELQLPDLSSDMYLNALINQASAAVTTWCKRVFAAETVRESLYPAAGCRSLMLARWPIMTIVAVTINGASEDPVNVEAEDSGQIFRIDANGCRTPWPSGRIVIDYRAGFVLPNSAGRTLPYDIERAAITLVRAAWFARDRDPMVRSESVQDVGSIDFFSGTVSRLPPEVEGLLTPYRSIKLV